MARSKDEGSKVKAQDAGAQEFYPEDARERNFKDARETSVANHEKDMATRNIGSTDPARVQKKEATEVINPVAAPLGSVPHGTEAAEGDKEQVGATDESNTAK